MGHDGFQIFVIGTGLGQFFIDQGFKFLEFLV